MKYFFTFFLGVFLTINGFTQNATITGSITDGQTGEAIFPATIQSGAIGTTTDIDGRFSLNLAAGNHTIEVSYIGYETLSQSLILKDGESRQINFTLEETATLLNTATVSSSKYEKPLGEVTVSLDVLKAQLIENTSATSISTALEKVSGVTLIDGQANIRGGSGWSYGAGSRVLLLIDDIPALQADAGFPNWSDVPIESIENVEVIKGAASALYGSSALNGVINIRTKYAKSEPYTRVSTFATLYDSPANDSLTWWKGEGTYYRFDEEGEINDTLQFTPKLFGGEPGYNRPAKIGFSIAHSQKMGTTDLVLSAFALNSQSFREAKYSKYARLFGGVRHRINDRLSVGFNTIINRGAGRNHFYWKNENEGRYQANVTAISHSDRLRFTIDPFITYFDQSGSRHKVLTRYYGINNNNDDGQDNKSGLFYSEYQFQKTWEKYDLNLATGLVGTWSKVNATLYGGEYTSSNYAAYLQVDKKFFDKLNVSAGVRYERNSLTNNDFIFEDTLLIYPAGTVSDAKPVFRVGASYQPFKFTFLRASWGQGYRFPVLAEKFILTSAGGIDVIPNPDLQPETGWSGEIGIKQGFKISNFNGFVDVALFWNEYNNMMEYVVNSEPNPFNKLFAFQSDNVGNTRIKGIETSIAGEGKLFGLPTTLLGGYTYIDPKFRDFNDSVRVSTVDYNILKYRNRHSVKLDIESRYKVFSLGISGNYNSKIEAIDVILGALVGIEKYRQRNNHGFKTFSARIGFFPSEHLRFMFIVDNLFNEEYMQRPGLLQAPRSFTLRMDYTL